MIYLKYLNCKGNNIKSLYFLRNCSSLETLNCEYNNIESLDGLQEFKWKKNNFVYLSPEFYLILNDFIKEVSESAPWVHDYVFKSWCFASDRRQTLVYLWSLVNRSDYKEELMSLFKKIVFNKRVKLMESKFLNFYSVKNIKMK